MITEKLAEAFSKSELKDRKGAGGRTFTYVPIGDVIRRVLNATGGKYAWEIIKLEQASDLKGSLVWICHGRLTIADMGSFDGIGTHPAQDEESPKAAESDCFKRAAVKVGVALHLYEDTDSPQMMPTQAQRAAHSQTAGNGAPVAAGDVWEGEGQCPHCKAPSGKRHATTCDTRGGRKIDEDAMAGASR